MAIESAKMQELGPKKYREMIDKSRKAAMDNPNLPFKPIPKSKIIGGGSKSIECDTCGANLTGSKYTCLIECKTCKKLVKVDSDYVS